MPYCNGEGPQSDFLCSLPDQLYVNFWGLPLISRSYRLCPGAFSKCHGIYTSRSNHQPKTKGKFGYQHLVPLTFSGLTLNVYFIPFLRIFLWVKPQSPIVAPCSMTCPLLAAFRPSHFPLPYECFLGSPPRGTTTLDPGLRVCLGEQKPRYHSSFCKEIRLEGTKMETLGRCEGRRVQVRKDGGPHQDGGT